MLKIVLIQARYTQTNSKRLSQVSNINIEEKVSRMTQIVLK